MTPEYIERLADIIDHDQLWRLPAGDQLSLRGTQRHQADAGVALRRHASHLRELRAALAAGQSLLITPLSINSSTRCHVPTPDDHARLRKSRQQVL